MATDIKNVYVYDLDPNYVKADLIKYDGSKFIVFYYPNLRNSYNLDACIYDRRDFFVRNIETGNQGLMTFDPSEDKWYIKNGTHVYNVEIIDRSK